MSVMQANTKVVGVLHSQGHSFSMLDLAPQKRAQIPLSLYERSLVFYCVVDGFAQNVVLSQNSSFLITPLLEPTELEVKYYIETEESELPAFVSENVE